MRHAPSRLVSEAIGRHGKPPRGFVPVEVGLGRAGAALHEGDPDHLDELIDELASFEFDPYGFVLWAFPWGEEGTSLADEEGPEDWQRDQLERIGRKLLSGGDIGAVVEEDVSAGHGVGKAQPLSLAIDTPNGLRLWGELQPGDLLFGRDGRPTRITARHDRGTRQVFRVVFDDGSSTLCCGDHLWTVRGRQQRRNGDGFITLSTSEIIKRGVKRNNGVALAAQWELPQIAAVQYRQEVKLPVHPYVLGVWLGDGGRNSGRITSGDQCMLGRLRELGETVSVGHKAGTDAKTLGIAGLHAKLRALGVADRYAHEKSVPLAYKQSSAESRAEVLRGLMDTDGEATANSGCAVFSTTSRALADDVMWLARSLGGKAMMQPTTKRPEYRDAHGNKVRGLPCHRVSLRMPAGFRTFYIERKQSRVRDCDNRYRARWIAAIEPAGEQPVMCVTVNATDSIYLTNDFIPTHNSALVSWLALWAISTHPDTRGVVTANTDTQLRTKTWAELGKWFQLFIAKELFKFTATAICGADSSHEKTWRIDALPWNKSNPAGFAGMHNKGKRILVIFDEASEIDDLIWEVTEGALTDEKTQIIWCRYGNPTRTSGKFHGNCTKPRRGTYTRVDSRTVRFTNKGQIEAWVEEYGEDSDFVRVRVKGQFPRAGVSNFISPELTEEARRRTVPRAAFEAHPRILSVDPARFGDDWSVITLRQGLKVHWQQAMMGFDGVDLGGRVAEVCKQIGNILCIAYDAVGNGADLDSTLRRIPGLPQLVPVMWGIPASDDKQYFNQRAEAWGRMRDWLKAGEIPDDDELCDQLTSLDYGYDAAYRIQLQKKADIKRNGGKSPDKADSLALSFIPDLIRREVTTAKVRPVQTRKVVWAHGR